jgi:hypothetical protein
MRIHRHTRDMLIAWGFSLAYVATMVLALAWEAGRLAAIRDELLRFGCGPAFVAGVAMLAAAYLLPLAEEPLIEESAKGRGG